MQAPSGRQMAERRLDPLWTPPPKQRCMARVDAATQTEAPRMAEVGAQTLPRDSGLIDIREFIAQCQALDQAEEAKAAETLKEEDEEEAEEEDEEEEEDWEEEEEAEAGEGEEEGASAAEVAEEEAAAAGAPAGVLLGGGVTPSAGDLALPLDEMAVLKGLAPKIFLDGCPDLAAAASLYEALWRRLEGQARISAVACAVVLARGVRGQAGVQWLSQVFAAGGLTPLLERGKPVRSLFPECARAVRKEFEEECKRRGNKLWPAHRDGRHVMMSGRHFLDALGSKVALDIATDIAERFCDVLRDIDAADGGALGDAALDRLISAWQGAVLREGEHRVTAALYSSADAGRSLWCHLLNLLFATCLLAGSMSQLASNRFKH